MKMASEKREMNRVRATRDMNTPQALGRCDSNPGQAPRQSKGSPAFCDTCPPIRVRPHLLPIGCLTVYDLHDCTGESIPKRGELAQDRIGSFRSGHLQKPQRLLNPLVQPFCTD